MSGKRMKKCGCFAGRGLAGDKYPHLCVITTQATSATSSHCRMCHRSPLNCLLGSRETQKGERTGADLPAAYWPVDAPGAAALWEQEAKKRHQENKQLSLVSQLVWQTSIFFVSLSWIRKAVFSFLLCVPMVLWVKVDLPDWCKSDIWDEALPATDHSKETRVIRDRNKGQNNFRIMNVAGPLQVKKIIYWMWWRDSDLFWQKSRIKTTW